jgi:hypothetical protein
MMKPHVPYVLIAEEFEVFANRIESLKMPMGYSSSLGKHIRGRKFGSLKSHDYHVLMQQIMPLTLRGLLTEGARMAVMHMCKIFCQLCTNLRSLTLFRPTLRKAWRCWRWSSLHLFLT